MGTLAMASLSKPMGVTVASLKKIVCSLHVLNEPISIEAFRLSAS